MASPLLIKIGLGPAWEGLVAMRVLCCVGEGKIWLWNALLPAKFDRSGASVSIASGKKSVQMPSTADARSRTDLCVR